MNRTLRSGVPARSPSRVFTSPRPSAQKHRVRQSGDGGPNQTSDRLTCSVCGFKGVNVTTTPGEHFPTGYQTTGTTYVWDSPDQPLSVIDKQVLPKPSPAVSCGFCGATRFLDGSKGKGQ
jgi:hypothetical protein